MWRCKGHESFCLQFPWDCCRNKMLVTIVHSLHVVNFILIFCQCEQSQPCDQVLTLVSNERIPFTPTMRMLLEVQDTTPRNIFQTQSHKTMPRTLEHEIYENWKPKNDHLVSWSRAAGVEFRVRVPRTWNMQVPPPSPVAESSTSTSHSDGSRMRRMQLPNLHFAAFWMLRCMLHAHLQTLSPSILTVTLWNLWKHLGRMLAGNPLWKAGEKLGHDFLSFLL